MSRWGRKTPEEKEQTAENILQNKERHQSKRGRMIEEGNKKKFAILEVGELPLRCSNCGITSSRHYTLSMVNYPTAKDPVQTAEGKCKQCGKRVRSIIDPAILGVDFTMIIVQVINLLDKKGRITDDRQKEVREWQEC